MLRSERMNLRAIRKSDLENSLKWFNDAEVIQYLTMFLPMTEIAEEKWIEEICTIRSNNNIIFVMEVINQSKTTPIGTCGLHNIDWKNRDAEAGMAIGEKAYWEKGYGTEALELLVAYGFNQLNLHRIFRWSVRIQ